MAKKKVINAGKIMVICGAVVILVLVALWCSSLLKMSHEQKNDSPENATQPTMSVNVIVPPVTTTTTITTVSEISQTTASYTDETTTETVTSLLTVKGNGEFQEYIIKLANPALEIYSEPSYNSMVTSTITDRGSYIIIKETVDDDGNKWGLLEDNSGWINLADARKSGDEDTTENTSDNNNADNDSNQDNNGNNTNNNQNNGNSNSYTGNPSSGLLGIDADGDGWDDGFNPDAWCPYCGYDSYYNSADGNYYCSQGHVWSY